MVVGKGRRNSCLAFQFKPALGPEKCRKPCNRPRRHGGARLGQIHDTTRAIRACMPSQQAKSGVTRKDTARFLYAPREKAQSATMRKWHPGRYPEISLVIKGKVQRGKAEHPPLLQRAFVQIGPASPEKGRKGNLVLVKPHNDRARGLRNAMCPKIILAPRGGNHLQSRPQLLPQIGQHRRDGVIVGGMRRNDLFDQRNMAANGSGRQWAAIANHDDGREAGATIRAGRG